MVKEPEISIVIPLYGSFNLERILISIQSITFQEEVNYEIIVSEQGESKKFPEIFLSPPQAFSNTHFFLFVKGIINQRSIKPISYKYHGYKS